MTLKLKRILISVLSILLIVCGAVALNFNATNSTFNASAEVIEVTIPSVQDIYNINTSKVFPASVETKVRPDDEQSPTVIADNGVIIYPDGKAYSVLANKEFSLNMIGIYTLRYFADHYNKEIIAEKVFRVTNNLYGLTLDNSSHIDFATAEYMQGLIDAGEFSPYSKASHSMNDPKATQNGEEALSVNLAMNTEFYYSEAIDLRNAGADGYTNILSFEPRAENYSYGPEGAKSAGKIDEVKDGVVVATRLKYPADNDQNDARDKKDGKNLYILALDENGDGVQDTDSEGKPLFARDDDSDGTPDKDASGNILYGYPMAAWYLEEVVARKLVIKITDCYDSSKYIKIIVDSPKATASSALNAPNKKYPCVRACTDTLITEWGIDSHARTEDYLTNTQKLGPNDVYTDNGNKTLFYDGVRYQAWTSRSSSQWFYGGEFGAYTYDSPNFSHLNIKYDYENARLYCSATNKDGIESDPVMFADFYNQELYPLSSGSFREFTTGEVFISIGFDAYASETDTARVDIFKLGDKNVSDLYDQADFDITGKNPQKFNDNKAPVINVDFNPTLNDGVYVAVGEKFTIPSATAVDMYLSGGVSANAYLNYGTDNELSIPIVNGQIQVPVADTFYIVYTAKDTSGNIGKKVIKVFGFDIDNHPNTIALEHNTEQFSDIKVGALNTFVAPSLIHTFNKSECLKLRIELVSEFEKVVLADLNGIEEIEQFKNSQTKYTLSYVGNYQVKYYLADNSGNNYDNPVSFPFNVEASNNFAISDEPFMYRHYIKGVKYDFDKVSAFGFTSGGPTYAADAELYVKFDGGQYVKQDGIYGVEITGSKTVQAKYVYGNATIETKEYPIVDVGITFDEGVAVVSYGNYFIGDFNIPETKSDGKKNTDIYLLSNKTGDNKIQYINPISVKDFSFGFTLEEAYSNFTGIKLILTDIYDVNNVMCVYIYKDGINTFIQYNNNEPVKMNGSLVNTTDSSIKFDSALKLLTITGGTGSANYIFTDAQFTTDEAYLDIELCGITGVGDAGIIIKELNKAKLNNKTVYDYNRPSFAGVIPTGTYNIGDIITISPAKFMDSTTIMIRENLKLEVKIGNNYVTSVDGVRLDGEHNDPTRSYSIELDQLGGYSVKYTATDISENTQSPTFYFSVVDNVAPEITFHGNIKEDIIIYAKTGYVVNLNFTITDNLTSSDALTYEIFVFNEHTGNVYVAQEKAFTLNYVGTYEISVVAYDADGNQTTKSLTVVISNPETNEEVK